MPGFLRFLTALAAASWTLSGCGPAAGSARGAFHDGRLPEAASELRIEEGAARAAGGRVLYRYARLRGLVELGVGNARAADHFLTIARHGDARDPGLFDARERGELESAWRSLGRMPGD